MKFKSQLKQCRETFQDHTTSIRPSPVTKMLSSPASKSNSMNSKTLNTISSDLLMKSTALSPNTTCYLTKRNAPRTNTRSKLRLTRRMSPIWEAMSTISNYKSIGSPSKLTKSWERIPPSKGCAKTVRLKSPNWWHPTERLRRTTNFKSNKTTLFQLLYLINLYS